MRIEQSDDGVILIFPAILDDWMTPWQEAWRFGEVLEQVARQCPIVITDQSTITEQTSKVKIGWYKQNVVLLFPHIDRLELCRESAIILARAVRMKAQDLYHKVNIGKTSGRT